VGVKSGKISQKRNKKKGKEKELRKIPTSLFVFLMLLAISSSFSFVELRRTDFRLQSKLNEQAWPFGLLRTSLCRWEI
jgi:hypothetical protein